MDRLSDHRIAIVMLAAGEGRRMGAASSPGAKLLLPLADGRPIIAHAVGNALDLGPSELVLVIRPDTPEIAAAALQGRKPASSSPGQSPIKYIANPRHEQGMATSLAAGIS